jgi:hypothetical protein
MSVAELQGLLEAPDLSPAERRELKRTIRFHRRIELWEERRSGPQPRKLHRAVLTIMMMALALALLVLLLRS